MILGEKIGAGTSRVVYDLADRPGYVVKLLTNRKTDRGKNNL